MTWYRGRGRNGANNAYWLKKYGIQSWINSHGSLSMPVSELKRIKSANVGFFDLKTGEKWVTPAQNFRNAEEVGGYVEVDIEHFNYIDREG